MVENPQNSTPWCFSQKYILINLFSPQFLGVGGALLLEKLVAIRKRRMNDRLQNQAHAIIAITQRISQTMPIAPNLNDIQNAI